MAYRKINQPNDFVTKKEAQQILGVGERSVEPICQKNNIRVWQVPGHTRRFYSKADLLNLVSAAQGVAS